VSPTDAVHAPACARVDKSEPVEQTCVHRIDAVHMFACICCILPSSSVGWCHTGPRSRLDETQFSQPALFVANLAALELLKVGAAADSRGRQKKAGCTLLLPLVLLP
jgi:malonyl CoA-acyl carrier protein transacylase